MCYLSRNTVFTWLDKQFIKYFKFPLFCLAGNTVINSLPKNYSLKDINKFVCKFTPNGSFPIVPLVHGFCICIKSNVLNKIGYLDDKNFQKYYGEENDFCMRATYAGFKLALATNLFIYHKKSASITSNQRKIHMKESAVRLRQIYGEKKNNRSHVADGKKSNFECHAKRIKYFFKKIIIF